MLSQIVGPVDFNSAAVLCVAFICLSAVASLAVTRRSRLALDQELELAKIRLRNEDEASKRQTDAKRDYELARMASEREIEFKRIDTNLITSHARVASE
ncbi:hypothetical protein GGQ85_002502 [Nitrobacter vulgaris]|jgi:hypothetical protein|uniref:Uncharacterized protein n=1 Tax=Nitrobacter vulgaris TaxID=29421 RepID=A0A1V4HZX8_NITVU|nr:hypothetical protein [Nitrobacter vulgaris]MDR6304787.1 hypothetical protein [Nitrobacter vulgaris]OPH83536.1 hypothetical protein B2M20_06375 [Nitrobacter vulgaris]